MRTSGDNLGQPSASTTLKTAEDVSAYVAEICRELALMARGTHLQLLAYLLDMAAQEAGRGTGVPPLSQNRRQRTAGSSIDPGA